MVKYLDFLWMIITVSYIINGTEGQGMDYQRKYCHKKYKIRDLTKLERFLCSKTRNRKENGKVSRPEVLNLNSLPFKKKFKYLFQNDAKKLIQFETCLRKSIQNSIIKCEDISKVYLCYAPLVSKNSHLLTKRQIPVEYMSNKRKSGDVGPPQSVIGMETFEEEFPNMSGNKRDDKYGLLDRKSYVTVEKSPNNNRVIRVLLRSAAEALTSGYHIVVDPVTDTIRYASDLIFLYVIDPFLEEFYNARKNKGEEPNPNSSDESLELGIRRVRNIRSLDKKQHIVSLVNKVSNPQLKTLSNLFPPESNAVTTVAGNAGHAAGFVINGITSVAQTIYDIFSSKNKTTNTNEIIDKSTRNIVEPIDVTDILTLITDDLPMMVDYIGPNIAKAARQISEQVSSAVVPYLILGINSLGNQFMDGLKIAIGSAVTHLINGAGVLLKQVKAPLQKLIKDIHILAET